MICLYATVSLLIGIAAELHGDPHEKVPVRLWHVVVYAVAWPAMAVLTLWFLWSLEDGEGLEGPYL